MAEAAVALEQESDSLVDDIESALDGAEVEESPEVETPEAVETADDPEGEAEAEGEGEETPAAAEAEPLQPQHHWPDKFKAGFTGMNREQQELWLEREREFERGFQARAQEAKQGRAFQEEIKQVFNPLVEDWRLKGLTPAAAMQRMVAREQALKADPQAALGQLAQEYGVNLQTMIEEAPYVDPHVQSLEQKLRDMEQAEQRRELEQRQAQQRLQAEQTEAAKRQFAAFVQATDDSGNPRFPYAGDDYVTGLMAQAINESGNTISLEQAYEAAMAKLSGHPFVKSQLEQVSSQVVQTNREKVERAKKASRTVDGKSPTPSDDSRTLTEDIESALREAGFED